jgi:hypothetical protein
VTIIEEGRFNVSEFAAELEVATSNVEVGSALTFENDWVRVWQVRLNPGERCAFHAHVLPYFWTCVDPGTGRQRSPDGTLKVRRYSDGETQFSPCSFVEPLIHDLENVGGTVLRFVTVEVLGQLTMT